MSSSESVESMDGLAAVLNKRVASDARIARAIGFGWICAGVAAASVLTSVGVAAALYGYSNIQSVRPAAEQIAKGLANALQNTPLKTVVSGTMKLAPNSEVKIADGQVVGLAEGAAVSLDPASSIRVIGDLKIDIPQPSREQLQLDAKSGSEELPFTSYTIFKSIDFGLGEVVTGWIFDLSDTTRPKAQYCYYDQPVTKGVSAKYTLAINALPRRPSSSSKLKFDFDGAVTNCIWFSGA